jgi:high affinity Mn2+ porin
VSLLLGGRLWEGAEAHANPELLQGFGLSNSTGIAGFTNGEAFKMGTTFPVAKLSRAFLQQTLARPGDRLTITLGKYAVVDLFDDNRYAHDSRSGFLNWTINELGAFDMASPAFNTTYGATAAWSRAWWTVRAGFFLEPTRPNSVEIDSTFRQFQPVVELEARQQVGGWPGKLKLLAFGKRVEAGSFTAALDLAHATGEPPSTALVRDHLAWGYGGGLNLEQQVTANLGIFARAGLQAGQYEEFAFTQVEESVSAGLVGTGARWGRDDDALGLGAVANGIFARERAYLAAGGTGIIIGDGALDYGGEAIAEIYYQLVPWRWAALTLDYQFVYHPAYNRDRGPVSVFGLRVHLEL